MLLHKEVIKTLKMQHDVGIAEQQGVKKQCRNDYIKQLSMNKMATIGKIRVCVLEGHQAELASAGLPLLVGLRLQQLDLSMSIAQWSIRQTNGGFSVLFFWLSLIRGA